jgi:hypothetical protein
MSFINGGVMYTSDETPILSKTALKALVKEDPYFVTFYLTSNLGPRWEGPLNKLPKEFSLQVCGPNPWTNRRWHAVIHRDARDTVRVS